MLMRLDCKSPFQKAASIARLSLTVVREDTHDTVLLLFISTIGRQEFLFERVCMVH